MNCFVGGSHVKRYVVDDDRDVAFLPLEEGESIRFDLGFADVMVACVLSQLWPETAIICSRDLQLLCLRSVYLERGRQQKMRIRSNVSDVMMMMLLWCQTKPPPPGEGREVSTTMDCVDSEKVAGRWSLRAACRARAVVIVGERIEQKKTIIISTEEEN